MPSNIRIRKRCIDCDKSLFHYKIGIRCNRCYNLYQSLKDKKQKKEMVNQYMTELPYYWGKTRLKYFCHKCKKQIIVSRKEKNSITIRCLKCKSSNLNFKGYLK